MEAPVQEQTETIDYNSLEKDVNLAGAPKLLPAPKPIISTEEKIARRLLRDKNKGAYEWGLDLAASHIEGALTREELDQQLGVLGDPDLIKTVLDKAYEMTTDYGAKLLCDHPRQLFCLPGEKYQPSTPQVARTTGLLGKVSGLLVRVLPYGKR